MEEEEIKIQMDDGVARFFTRFGENLFVCGLVGGAALSRGPRMRLPQVRAEACISLQAS